jgi:two-component system, NtrC family, nitrogen regulation sensor histidine kinase GlnL
LKTLAQIKQLKLQYQQQFPNHIVTAIVILDDALTIQYTSPSAEALLVQSQNKLLGSHFSDILKCSALNATLITELLSSGKILSICDASLDLIDGEQITIEITASSVEINQQAHILLEFRQIDQQKQISLEISQEQQWESARDLIKGLAHEVKNPLGGLRGAAQLLSRELTDEQQEYTSMIIEQADRLTNLVDQLLGPNQLPNFCEQNIHTVLEKVHQLVSFNNEKNIKLRRDYDPSIPDISFDEDKMQQSILNIVNNAYQAIESNSTITLKTRIARNRTISGKQVRLSAQISLIDNGPGIPEHIQDTLFYPMVSGRKNGTGLGLSISQTLIHQHHGKLSCISRPGHTEFTILLPISE